MTTLRRRPSPFEPQTSNTALELFFDLAARIDDACKNVGTPEQPVWERALAAAWIDLPGNSAEPHQRATRAALRLLLERKRLDLVEQTVLARVKRDDVRRAASELRQVYPADTPGKMALALVQEFATAVLRGAPEPTLDLDAVRDALLREMGDSWANLLGLKGDRLLQAQSIYLEVRDMGDRGSSSGELALNLADVPGFHQPKKGVNKLVKPRPSRHIKVILNRMVEAGYLKPDGGEGGHRRYVVGRPIHGAPPESD